MASYKETIERITEQTIEQEIRDDIDAIKLYAIGGDGNGGEVSRIKSETLAYIDEKKVELAKFGNTSIATAKATYKNICQINNDTDEIAEDTIAEIKANIRQMIVDNGYVMKIECDENGNADIVLTKEVAE